MKRVGVGEHLLLKPPVEVTLDDGEAHHAVRVLRLRRDEQVQLFDGAGRVAHGRVRFVNKREARVVVSIEHLQCEMRPTPHVTIATAIPKGAHAEQMVRQLTQLGVDRLIPLHTARSVVTPRGGKLERLRRGVIESCKQCGGNFLMRIEAPEHLETLLNHGENDFKCIAAPGANGVSVSKADFGMARRVLILIGPEGGWTREELEATGTAGFRAWRLGPHVLRVETAAAAAAAIVRYLTSDRDAGADRGGFEARGGCG